MKLSEEYRVNQLDEAHQDILSVLDQITDIELDKKQIGLLAEHIAGAKDKIYYDYIEDSIRQLHSNGQENNWYKDSRQESIRQVIKSALKEEIDKNE